MAQRLRIALVAHDAKKDALVGWAKRWEAWLAGHALLGTGSSAGEVERACPSLRVERLRSGPEGGDMQVGARIVEGAVDALVFLPDPMNPHPHEADVHEAPGPPPARAMVRAAAPSPAGRGARPAIAPESSRNGWAREPVQGRAEPLHRVTMTAACWCEGTTDRYSYCRPVSTTNSWKALNSWSLHPG